MIAFHQSSSSVGGIGDLQGIGFSFAGLPDTHIFMLRGPFSYPIAAQNSDTKARLPPDEGSVFPKHLLLRIGVRTKAVGPTKV